MRGADAAIAKYPFIDSTQIAAAGGSFGGYMVDSMPRIRSGSSAPSAMRVRTTW